MGPVKDHRLEGVETTTIDVGFYFDPTHIFV